MVKNVDEEKIKRLLTDPRTSAIKAMLEKDHAIDCLLLLYVGRGKWKEAKDDTYLRLFWVENRIFVVKLFNV